MDRKIIYQHRRGYQNKHNQHVQKFMVIFVTDNHLQLLLIEYRKQLLFVKFLDKNKCLKIFTRLSCEHVAIKI